jgi:hypothetical protein
MIDSTPNTWQESLNLGFNYTVAQFSSFLPRLLAATLIIFVGVIVAKIFRKLVAKTLEAFRFSKVVEKTPLELFLKNAEVGSKLEEGVATLFYWLFLFVVLYTAVSVLGLTSLSDVLNKILGYIPHIFSAIIIFLAGVLLAGFVESFIKGSLRNLDVHTARLFAKVSSYMVVVIAILAAVSELGIASQFLTILFVGVVFAFSLGAGLAFGLGGQDTVRKILSDWYKKTQE